MSVEVTGNKPENIKVDNESKVKSDQGVALFLDSDKIPEIENIKQINPSIARQFIHNFNGLVRSISRLLSTSWLSGVARSSSSEKPNISGSIEISTIIDQNGNLEQPKESVNISENSEEIDFVHAKNASPSTIDKQRDIKEYIKNGQEDHNKLRQSQFSHLTCSANEQILNSNASEQDKYGLIEKNIMTRVATERYPTDGGSESYKESAEFCNLMCFKESLRTLDNVAKTGDDSVKSECHVTRNLLFKQFFQNEQLILSGDTSTGNNVVSSVLKGGAYIKIIQNKTGENSSELIKIFTEKRELEKTKSEVKELDQLWCVKSDSFTDRFGASHQFEIVPANESSQERNSKWGFKVIEGLCSGTTLKGCEQTKGMGVIVPELLCNSNQRSYVKGGRRIAKAHTHAAASLDGLTGNDRLLAARSKARQFLERAMEQELQDNAKRNNGVINIHEANCMDLQVMSQSLMSSVQGGINTASDQQEILRLLNNEDEKQALLEQAVSSMSITKSDPAGGQLSAQYMTCSSAMGQTGVNEGEYISRTAHAIRFSIGSELDSVVDKTVQDIDGLTNIMDELLNIMGDDISLSDVKVSLQSSLKASSDAKEKQQLGRQLKLLGALKSKDFHQAKDEISLKKVKLSQLLTARNKEAKWDKVSFFTRRNAYKQPVLQLLLAQECGMAININCMSGKDRTGETWNQFALFANHLDSVKDPDQLTKVIDKVNVTRQSGQSYFNHEEKMDNVRFVEHTCGRHVTERNGYVNEYKNERKGQIGMISYRNDFRELAMYGVTGRERTQFTKA